MLKKAIQFITVASVLLACPCFAINLQENDLEESHDLIRRVGKRHEDEETRLVKLCDFSGAWVLAADSLGGLAGSDVTGVSMTIDGQVTFDKLGQGSVNYLAISIYEGDPGTFEHIVAAPNSTTATLTIIDPVNGIGSLFISNPSVSFSTTVEFVTIRSRSSGRAIRLEGHRSVDSETAASVNAFTLVRQYQ